MSLSEEAKNFDVLILSDYLSSNNLLRDAGGEEYLIDIVTNTPSISNLNTYLELLSKKSIKRELSKVLIESNQLIHKASDDIENEVLAKVEENIYSR